MAARCGAVLLLLAFLTFAAPSSAAAACRSGYSYAGIAGSAPAAGVSATVTALRSARVTSGHVAAWVGVGGRGLGPGGTDEWLQVGISSLPGGRSEIYAEVARPGSAPVYMPLLPVAVGESHEVALYESGTPGMWTVRIDGNPVGLPIALPGAHAAWIPVVTSESFNGGVTSCNRYSFLFSGMRVASAGGAWLPLRNVQRFGDGGASVRARRGWLLVRQW